MRSVIVGAGIAGLSLAVELRRRRCDVTIVERRYPGAGNSTRNVGRVRRMQLTPDLTAYACRASDTWKRLDELAGGRNPLLYPTTYVWVLYDDAERAMVEPLEAMWAEFGANASIVGRDEVLAAVPVLRGGEDPVGGIVGEAGIVHHDAAVYALLLRAREVGVRFEIGAAVTGLVVENGRAAGVTLSDGRTLRADHVVNAAGGRSSQLAEKFGVPIPNAPLRREVLVTAPRRPFMTPAVSFYRPQEGWFNQTLRGELVAGVVDVDEPFGMNESSSVRFLGRTARIILSKAPRLAELPVIRQWAGVYDTTPDKRPLVGQHHELPGLWSLNGWSGRGILLAPLSAELLAREMAGEGRDDALASFHPSRFTGTNAAVSRSDDYYGSYAH
jgi:glycine/D-amino acid oxidase-like deaminating enzyme